jgi:hypothetical protein
MTQSATNSNVPAAGKTAREWLLDYGGKLVEPTPQDLADLDRVMEHDEFWEWSSGKIELPIIGNTSWWQTGRDMAVIASILGGWLLVLMLVGWLVRG